VALALVLLASVLAASAGALSRTTALVSKPTGVIDPNTDDVTFKGASQDGRRVFFSTTQKLTADDTDGGLRDIYMRAGGVTTLVSKPAAGVTDPNSADVFFEGASDDGSRVFFTTTQQMATADGDSSLTDVYEHAGGTTTLVSQPTALLDLESDDMSFRGATPDGSHVFFQTAQPMTSDPDDNDSSRVDVYERAGGTTTLVSKPAGIADADTHDARFEGASADGSHVFFSTRQKMVSADNDASRTDVYERASGTTTLVSQPTGIPDADTAGASFGGVSNDGSRVFFTTGQKMVSGDVDSDLADVYERSAGSTTWLSQPTGIADADTAGASLVGVSQDGNHVFFETAQKMTADDGDTNLKDVYERAGGTTALLSTPTGIADPNSDLVDFRAAAPDGSRVVFETAQKMTTDDGDSGGSDVFARAGGTTTLLSKPNGVTDPGAPVAFVGASKSCSRVFFITAGKMTGDDLDSGLADVYESAGGTTTLVSKPTAIADPNSGDAFFQGASADGTHVFFDTTQQLTADDTDTARFDLYAALPLPSVATGVATGVGKGGATLRGTVNPNGQATTYRFDIGKTTAYGMQTPVASAGSGEAAVAASHAIGGLAPSTTYHFRLRATNSYGTAVGGDRTFRTAPTGVPVPAEADLSHVKKAIRVSRKRRFKVSFGATAGLTGTATFRSVDAVRVAKLKRVTLARKSFTVPRSGTVTLRIRLSRKSFRILRLNRKIKVRLRVTLKNAAGVTSAASKTITMKAPKPPPPR
jgi:hypothetical protein